MTDGLDVIFPAEVSGTINGEGISISPIRIGQLKEFSTAIEHIAVDIFNLFSSENVYPSLISDFIKQHTDSLIDAVCIATKQPKEKISDMMLDEFVNLVILVIQVNMDFFALRLLPSVKISVEALRLSAEKIKAQTPGLQQSMPSSATATA